MLIEFKVGNFLSFKEVVTLSMVASSDREHEETNTIPVNDKLKLLKNAVLYGANAGGKSNLIKAIAFMKDFVLSSSKESSTDKISVKKFRLSTETENEPSTFEITFMIENIRYRYGFQADNEQVHSEWLFYVPTIREATLFTREKDKIKLGEAFKEGKGLESKTRPNALFLSVVDQFNGQTSGKIIKWFSKLIIISGIDDSGLEMRAIEKLKEKKFKDFTKKLLKIADMAIQDIQKEELQIDKENLQNLPEKMPPELKKRLIENEVGIIKISTAHQKYDRDNKPVSEEKFDLFENESTGTQALFAFSAPIYDALLNDRILFIDELTSKLHPLLTRALIEIFNNAKQGKNGKPGSKGQLIFTCHDTNILTNQFFRRDQIWFTQKDKYGATELYSLDEYKVRKDASFNKDYIMGKYGAIPFIGDIESLFEDCTNEA
jgi:AAA15 family ATPase/GTPase